MLVFISFWLLKFSFQKHTYCFHNTWFLILWLKFIIYLKIHIYKMIQLKCHWILGSYSNIQISFFLRHYKKLFWIWHDFLHLILMLIKISSFKNFLLIFTFKHIFQLKSWNFELWNIFPFNAYKIIITNKCYVNASTVSAVQINKFTWFYILKWQFNQSNLEFIEYTI